jgi:hypothetical protein
LADIQAPSQGFTLTVDGLADVDFQQWMEDVTAAANNSAPLAGTGTPESNQVAVVGRWYVDTAAAVSSGIYFKETGEGDTGWVQRS